MRRLWWLQLLLLLWCLAIVLPPLLLLLLRGVKSLTTGKPGELRLQLTTRKSSRLGRQPKLLLGLGELRKALLLLLSEWRGLRLSRAGTVGAAQVRVGRGIHQGANRDI